MMSWASEDWLASLDLAPPTAFAFGAGASFLRLAMAFVSEDKPAFFSAVCELGAVARSRGTHPGACWGV